MSADVRGAMVYARGVDDPDVQLLEAWRAGDERAGSELLKRQFPALFRFFRSKAEAEAVPELIQRTMLKCVEHRDRFEGRSRFSTYVYAIARSELIAHLRTRSRDARLFDPAVATADDVVPSPSVGLVHRERHRLLLRGLRRLPLDHQILIELHYWEDMRGPELAQVLDVPEGTVRTRLRRARTLLRDALAAAVADSHLVESTMDELASWAASLREEIDSGRDQSSP